MNHAPKFPMPSLWEYMLHYHTLSKNPDAVKAVTSILDNMADGGIYDQIGGGFSRYSTDASWHIPHFEKMLYDNAQLVSLCSHACQLTKDPLYKNVVYQTLGFIGREMTSSDRGFYSSLDADSEGEEGKLYVWTREEVESVLGNKAPLFLDYFDITKSGNWEHGKNDEITRNFKNGNSSVPGLLDDYSFIISAFVDLYQATFDEKWLYKAKDLTDYAIQHFFDSSSGMFYYTPDNHSELIARKMEIEDNVIHSSNSEMAMNLFLPGNYFNNESFIQKAQQMLNNVQKSLQQNIFSYSNWGQLGIHFIKPVYEMAIVGSDWDRLRKTIDNYYLPDAIFLGGGNEGTLSLPEGKLVSGQTIIYVCVNKTCLIPVTDAEKAIQQMK